MLHRPSTFAYIVAVSLMASAAPAAAQLRPLEPLDWRLFDGDRTASIEAGGGAYSDQRAALAGEIGSLYELGAFRAFWRTGRVVFEAAGTVQRFFRIRQAYAPPDSHVEAADRPWRHDSGDYLVISTVRLTPDDAPLLGVLRFGTRLPTTDNRTGLERDMTDFFALAGAQLRRGGVRLGGEAGVSINGTRDPGFEQKDVLVYALHADYDAGALVPSVRLVGDVLGPRHRTLRGNEPLGEARFGVRTHGRRWLRAEVVTGYREYSPRLGWRVAAGMAW